MNSRCPRPALWSQRLWDEKIKAPPDVLMGAVASTTIATWILMISPQIVDDYIGKSATEVFACRSFFEYTLYC
jgi:hypothetical protein